MRTAVLNARRRESDLGSHAKVYSLGYDSERVLLVLGFPLSR